MKNRTESFATFQKKIAYRVLGGAIASVCVVFGLYLFLWKERFGNWVVSFLEFFMKIEHEKAFLIYHNNFRGYKEIFFIAAIIVIFLLFLLLLFRWMTRYFKEINQGIDALLEDNGDQIHLSPEMFPFEYKLNTVKETLTRQKEETTLAERRKDELVMYLAHDIRTPLTSVIGYLSLLEEAHDMLPAERAKNVHIALDKAYRLENMINEFFEITRYNSKQVKLSKKPVDVYYMLVQLCDELLPIFARRGNSVALNFSENLMICADPEKLVRVFSNILKNAAAYSYPETEITVTAKENENQTIILFKNKGKTIPADKLEALFDKFYRLDKARITDTGGTGLGLAIAKEIVVLHGGTIDAHSENETITFSVKLPVCN